MPFRSMLCAGVSGGGVSIAAEWSSIVFKIESLPSRLSMISIRRVCEGQSASAAVLMFQNPPLPSGLAYGSTWFTCECPATNAITFR